MSDTEGEHPSHEISPSDEERSSKKDDDSNTKELAAEIAQQVLAALQSQPATSKGKYQRTPLHPGGCDLIRG